MAAVVPDGLVSAVKPVGYPDAMTPLDAATLHVFQHKIVRRGLVGMTPPGRIDVRSGLSHLIAHDAIWTAEFIQRLFDEIIALSQKLGG
jgi:hypothetical protein